MSRAKAMHSLPGTGEVSLRTRGLTVQFGGQRAVAEVSLEFQKGTLTAIVGPNGAGKTTFFNLVSGQVKRTEGRVELMGEDVSEKPAHARTRLGIGRAFQLTNLFPDLSVHENVRLAIQATVRGAHNRPLDFLFSRSLMHQDLRECATKVLDSVDLQHKGDLKASMLSHGDQRKLEVAILMALDAEVLMFDEPTAGMTYAEAPAILRLISELKKDKSKTIILVEHKMNVVRELADRIVVMVDGAVVADGHPEDVIALPVVQEAYLGRATAETGQHHA